MAENLVENNVFKCIGDVSILLIDHDTASVTSLTTMLDQFSNKVMTVDMASKAIPMIEKQKDIGLIIVNTEMPHLDMNSFLNDLLDKDIPLILISPETNTNDASSDLLSKRACFCLKKPISENDIKKILQHVMVPKKNPELEKTNIAEKHDHVLDESVNQIEAFRETLKRQRTSSQSSLVGTRRPFIKTFTTFDKRRNIASDYDQWKNKPVSCIESIVGRRCNIWTYERHMKFLAAISILGEKDSRPKSILRIMNDPNLTHRQVASHLQKYKAQIDRISDTLPRNECKSTDKTFEYPSDYVYPFKTSNLKKNLIESNSLWYSLEKKKSSSSSTVQYSFKKAAEERESKMPKLDQSNLSTSDHGNVSNKSSMSPTYVPLATSNNPPYSISSKSDDIGVVSTGLSCDNTHGASNLDTLPMESARICAPRDGADPFQSPSHGLGTNINQVDLGHPSSIPNTYVPQPDLLCPMGEIYSFLQDFAVNPLETDKDPMGLVPSLENFGHHETNMNPMDWVPSADSSVFPEIDMNMIVHETNTNQMGCAVTSGESNVLSGDMIFQETNANDYGFVYGETSYETNTNQMDWFFSEESYALRENMVASDETNTTTQVGLVSCQTSYNAGLDNVVPLETSMDEMGLVPFDTSYAALDNVNHLETSMDEMGFVPCEGGNEVAIEDLICFDTDFNEMDLVMDSIPEDNDLACMDWFNEK